MYSLLRLGMLETYSWGLIKISQVFLENVYALKEELFFRRRAKKSEEY